MTCDDRTFDQNDAGADDFSEERVGDADHRDLLYRQVKLNASLYFTGVHVKARPDDNCLAATDQIQIPVLVQNPEVPGENISTSVVRVHGLLRLSVVADHDAPGLPSGLANPLDRRFFLMRLSDADCRSRKRLVDYSSLLIRSIVRACDGKRRGGLHRRR